MLSYVTRISKKTGVGCEIYLISFDVGSRQIKLVREDLNNCDCTHGLFASSGL